MSLLEGTPPSIAQAQAEPKTVLVYPRGMELGEGRSLLESADIECAPADPSFTSNLSSERRSIFLIDHERLRALGDHKAIEKALTVINSTGGAAIVLSDPGDFDAAWL